MDASDAVGKPCEVKTIHLPYRTSMLYHLAADAILLIHLLFVAFVVIGLLLIFLGKRCGWSWVRNPWFRLTHVAAIGAVTVQSWLGVMCPLTKWEKTLRLHAGEVVYTGSFISHLVETILYYNAPLWVFTVCYTLFGALVAASWLWVRPRPFFQTSGEKSRSEENTRFFIKKKQ